VRNGKLNLPLFPYSLKKRGERDGKGENKKPPLIAERGLFLILKR